MDIESIAKNHASVIADINVGRIVDHGDTIGIEFSKDGKFCVCPDCAAWNLTKDMPDPSLWPSPDDE